MLSFYGITFFIYYLYGKSTVAVGSLGGWYGDIEYLIRFLHGTIIDRVGKHKIIGPAVYHPVLFAPDKGSETRKKIAKKGEDMVDELKEKFGEFVDSVTEKVESKKEASAE